MKFKIAVCDDEEYYREQIKKSIKEHLEKKDISFSIDEFKNGMEFCNDEENIFRYDIIFLDIDMQGTNGMDIAYKIREKNKKIEIVFITVMLEYSMEGYHVEALRFIPKSDLEKLLPESLDVFLQKSEKLGKKIKFPFVGGTREILLDEIFYIESKAHKLIFERADTNLYMYGKINNLETELAQYGFVRTHQSYLVNLARVERINNYMIYLADGTQIPVTKSRYKQVKELYLQYIETI